MKRSFIYKAKINKATEANANQWLYLCRTLYNLALEQRITVYKSHKKSLSLYDQQNQLPEFKKAFSEFKTVNAQCFQGVLNALDEAYKSFFRRCKNGEKPGFPKFKGKDFFNSFRLIQNGWKLGGRNLHIANIGRFKLFLSRPIEGDIKTITIRKTHTNKWLISFSCDNVPIKPYPKTRKEIGIDVGLKSFCVDSDGNSFDNPKYFRQSEKELRRKQRSLSRKKKGSYHRKKAKLQVAKIHEKIDNQRRDFLVKMANYYVKNYDKIYIEDIKVKNLLHNKYLNKSISDVSWNKFFTFLQQKAEESGREIIKVNPRGTTQLCSSCGEKVPKTLAVRIHRCPKCGLKIDRDLNAALNIKAFGQNVQASTSELSGVA